MIMYIFRKRNDIVEKFEIVSVDREGIYLAKKRFGRWFNPELTKLLEKLLDGDYTVTAKILNMPILDIFGVKKCFKMEICDNILLEDYFRAVKFFNTSVPQGPVEVDNSIKLYSGFYYTNEGDRLVKYGVKFDTDRLVNIKVHCLAQCDYLNNGYLINLLDELLNGDFSIVPQIFRITDGEIRCNCEEMPCRQYFDAIKSAIKVEEYVSLSNSEFYDFTRVLNIDCPEDFVPVVPDGYKKGKDGSTQFESGTTGDPFAQDADKDSKAGDLILDQRLAYAREQLELSIQSHDDISIARWKDIISQIEQAYSAGTMEPVVKQL